MGNYSGFIINFEEERRSELLKELLGIEEEFTEALSAPDWEIKQWEVCFLSFEREKINYVCLAQRGHRAVTAKYRVKFSHFIDLDGIAIGEIERYLKPNLKRYFVNTYSGIGKRIPFITWNSFIDAIKILRPQQAPAIDELLKLREASIKNYTGRAYDIVAFERDAVGVALDIFDPSSSLRKKTLMNWAPEHVEISPFLAGIGAINLTEEQMLAHDMNVFPGADKYHMLLGTQFKMENRVLDVIYANRTEIETNLGADLIYYNHNFDAFTLIQYKRMKKERVKDNDPETAVFRPSSDRNFETEIERMKSLRKEFPDRWGDSKAWEKYRLNGDGFFFKFCPSINLTPFSTDLVKGMYIPREYIESLIASTLTDGPRAGKIISYENVQRYFNNTDFTKLVSDGWIGTRGISSAEITKIVSESLRADRSIIYARSSTMP